MTAATTLVDLFSISEPQNATNIKVDPIKKVGRTETISIYTILQDLFVPWIRQLGMSANAKQSN